jgi:hypothetical protein
MVKFRIILLLVLLMVTVLYSQNIQLEEEIALVKSKNIKLRKFLKKSRSKNVELKKFLKKSRSKNAGLSADLLSSKSTSIKLRNILKDIRSTSRKKGNQIDSLSKLVVRLKRRLKRCRNRLHHQHHNIYNTWNRKPNLFCVNKFDVAILQRMLYESSLKNGASIDSISHDIDSIVFMFEHVTKKLKAKYDTMYFIPDRIRTPFVMNKMAKYYMPNDTLKGFRTFLKCSTFYDTSDLINNIDSAYIDSITPYFWKKRSERFDNLMSSTNMRTYYDYQGSNYFDHGDSEMTMRDLSLIGLMSNHSDSLEGYSFVEKYTENEASNLILHMGTEIRKYAINYGDPLHKKQRRIQFMWLLSKYAENLTGDYLKGFETRALCDSVYTNDNYVFQLTRVEMKKRPRFFKEFLFQFYAIYLGDPQ